MKKIQYLTVLTILMSSIFSSAQSPNFEKVLFPNRIDFRETDGVLASDKTGNYDLKHYRFDLNVDPAEYFISGSVTPRFLITEENTSSIYFDFNSIMVVDSVVYHNQKVNHSFSGDFELKIDLPNELILNEIDSIKIWYHGNPSISGFGSFVADTQRCDKTEFLMWTLSEPYGARDWWPTKQVLNDKIDSIDMFVTTPKKYKVASNGLLLSVINKVDNSTHHWKHTYPEPAYLIAFAVSNYAEYIDWVPLDNGDSLMVLEYVFPCNLETAKNMTPDIIPTMQFFIDLFGDYPFDKEKYGHAQFGWGGGMEHSSMTFVTRFTHGLLAHELAHQWFGDKITCGSWQDIWLNEGFATYLEGLTYDFGRDPNGWEKWKDDNKKYALYASSSSVFVTDTTSVNRIFSFTTSYSKGAYLLHMLRWKMGDDAFFKALKNYINDPNLVYSYARTKDLQKHLEEQSGLDLNEFFKDWLYGKGNPTYSIDWWSNNSKSISIKVNQTQSNPSVDYFEMPIPIQIKGIGQDTTYILDNKSNEEVFTFDIDFLPYELIFDPDNWICAYYNGSNFLKTTILQSDDISIFPNPTSDIVNIDLGKQLFTKQLSILDINGKTVKSKSINNTITSTKFSVLDIPTGIYTLKILTIDGVYIKKLIIK